MAGFSGSSPTALLIIFIFIFIFSCGIGAAEYLPTQQKVFNIMQYGAKSNADSTNAILSAWNDACEFSENGKTAKIVVPSQTFYANVLLLQGPCKGPVEFHLAGTLVAPANLENPDGTWIHFIHVHGLSVTGGGKLNGEGQRAWDIVKQTGKMDVKYCLTSLQFTDVTDLTMTSIASIDSKGFHIVVMGSTNVYLGDMTVSAPSDSPNTDGIHFGGTRNVTLDGGNIGTGDDCVSISDDCNDVTVTGVACGPGHGISVGSLGKLPNERDVTNVKVRNCTFTSTMNGVRIKSYQSSPSTSWAWNFTFENIIMYNAGNPIIIDQEYCPSNKCDPRSPSLVKIKQITFKNITGSSSNKTAITLNCSKRYPCQNLKLDTVDLSYGGSTQQAEAVCENVGGITFANTVNPVPRC